MAPSSHDLVTEGRLADALAALAEQLRHELREAIATERSTAAAQLATLPQFGAAPCAAEGRTPRLSPRTSPRAGSRHCRRPSPRTWLAPRTWLEDGLEVKGRAAEAEAAGESAAGEALDGERAVWPEERALGSAATGEQAAKAERDAVASTLQEPNGQEPGAGEWEGGSGSGNGQARSELPLPLHARASQATLDSFTEYDDLFIFEKSMWDTCVFIGTPPVGLLGSVFTAGALLANAAVQILMCLFINDSLTRQTFSEDTVADFWHWRASVAHDLRFADSLTGESLVSRMCQFSDVPFSSGPQSGLEAISEYMPTEESLEHRQAPTLGYIWRSELVVGKLVCLIALLVWWYTVLREADLIFDMGGSIWRLPGGGTSISMRGRSLKLESVSLGRKLLVGSVLLLRSFVCGALLVTGTIYLVYTISLGDLLLNALALEIVLKLDELFFAVLAPVAVRRIIDSLEPLRTSRGALGWRGLDARPVVNALLTLLGGVCVIAWFLDPQIELLQKAQAALCGGNRDFVAAVDQMGFVVAFDATAPYDDQLANVIMSPSTEIAVTDRYLYRALVELVDKKSAANQAIPSGSLSYAAVGTTGNRISVEGIRDSSAEELGSMFNVPCVDFDYNGTPGNLYWPIMQDILADTGVLTKPIDSCQDLGVLCFQEGTMGMRARQYCPVTCGCKNPGSKLMFVSPEHGCATTCSGSLAYLEKMGSLRCKDWTPNDSQMLEGQDVLALYLESFMHISDWGESWLREGASLINASLYADGCAGFANDMKSSPEWWLNTWLGDLCKEGNPWRVKPLTSVCPVSCGCLEEDRILCPTACSNAAG